VTITDGSKSVRWLNEIEYINGEVWGMIWQTECIARVDPKDGSVIGWLLMDGCDSARSQHGTRGPSLLSSTRDHVVPAAAGAVRLTPYCLHLAPRIPASHLRLTECLSRGMPCCIAA
jgi:hypothetical protein